MKKAILGPSPPAGRDARERWAEFALDPVSLEVPCTWLARVPEWTEHSACVRWETLQERALELRWEWAFTEKVEDRVAADKRLGETWLRATAVLEDSAKETGATFAWTGNARPVEDYVSSGKNRFGRVREYLWNGRPCVLAILRLEAEKARAWVTATVRPSAVGEEPQEVARRILRTLSVRASGEPLRIRLYGIELAWPAELRLYSLRGKEGHVVLEFRDRNRRLTAARSVPAELFLYRTKEMPTFQTMVRTLFARGGRPEDRTPAEIAGHAGYYFEERRRRHVVFGDWLARRFGRSYSGRSGALAWVCPTTHALWAVSAQCGAADAEKELRQRLDELHCHQRGSAAGRKKSPALPGAFPLSELNWQPFVKGEIKFGLEAAAEKVRAAEKAVKPADEAGGATEAVADEEVGGAVQRVERAVVGAAATVKAHAAAKVDRWTGKDVAAPDKTATASFQKARQLSFRVRRIKEVSLEPSAYDAGGMLVFPAGRPEGLLARLMVGRGSSDETRMRRVAVDPVGRFIWERLQGDPRLGELLADLSTAFGVHPVQIFPTLLKFMQMLGERRMVCASPRNDRRLFPENDKTPPIAT